MRWEIPAAVFTAAFLCGDWSWAGSSKVASGEGGRGFTDSVNHAIIDVRR